MFYFVGFCAMTAFALILSRKFFKEWFHDVTLQNVIISAMYWLLIFVCIQTLMEKEDHLHYRNETAVYELEKHDGTYYTSYDTRVSVYIKTTDGSITRKTFDENLVTIVPDSQKPEISICTSKAEEFTMLGMRFSVEDAKFWFCKDITKEDIAEKITEVIIHIPSDKEVLLDNSVSSDFCTVCGQEEESGWSFCSSCGNKLQD